MLNVSDCQRWQWWRAIRKITFTQEQGSCDVIMALTKRGPWCYFRVASSLLRKNENYSVRYLASNLYKQKIRTPQLTGHENGEKKTKKKKICSNISRTWSSPALALICELISASEQGKDGIQPLLKRQMKIIRRTCDPFSASGHPPGRSTDIRTHDSLLADGQNNVRVRVCVCLCRNGREGKG